MSQHDFLIELKQAKQLINNSDQCLIVDIRDIDSYNQSHIEKAVHLSNDNINQFISTTDKSTPILVYCYKGNSSKEAAHYLLHQGFQTVYSLEGGFEAWQQG